MILARILEHKKAELRHKQSRGYLSELKAKIQDAPSPLGFAIALDATRTANEIGNTACSTFRRSSAGRDPDMLGSAPAARPRRCTPR